MLIKLVNAGEIFANVGYSMQRPQWHGPGDQKQKKVYEQWNNPEMEDLTYFTNSPST